MRRFLLTALLTCLAAGAAAARQAGDYIIGPQDQLSITVFYQPELSGKFTVDLDGSLSFPLLGRVHAGGLTLRDVEQAIQAGLAEGFLKKPQVAVSVEQYRSQRVFVVGEVRNAGTYALTGGMTLIEALAKAGSATAAASDEVTVVRSQGADAAVLPDAAASADVVRVNLKSLQSGAPGGSNVALRDGDTVYVPRAELVHLFGQVKNPGAYPIASGTTVLQALSLAGGVTPQAAVNRIKVQRGAAGSLQSVSIRLTDVVQSGDTIVVPERFF